MARYKRYKVGGKTVPGMYTKQEGGDTSMSPDERRRMSPSSSDASMKEANIDFRDKMMNDKMRVMTDASRMDNMGNTPNPMQVHMMKLKAEKLKREQMKQEMMMQLKLQNENLMQQNALLKTQIEKQDLINSARTTKTLTGPKSSPKRKGGRVKFPTNGIAGNAFRHGGSCLPKGRFSKKRK